MDKIINIGKYLLSLFSLIISAFALRHAYTHLHIPRTYWLYAVGIILLYLAIVAIILLKLKNRRTVINIIGLQAIPLAMSLLVFYIVPKMEPARTGMNNYERKFNDKQSVQIKAAKKNGIQPLETRKDAESAILNGKRLVHISSNDKYHVRKLDYSVPYLVPKATELLEDLAESFQALSGNSSRFEVTSVLRTKEDIAKLQKTNSNATTNSCHCYGTTFDISYARFKSTIKSNKELRENLSEALYKLQKEKRCYVKFEKKQKCYHITVR